MGGRRGRRGTAPVDLGAASPRELADVEATTRRGRRAVVEHHPDSGPSTETSAETRLRQLLRRGAGLPRRRCRRRSTTCVAGSGPARGGYAVLIGPGTADRAVERLREAELPAVRAGDAYRDAGAGRVTVTTGRLASGLVSEKLGLALLTESDLTGQRGHQPRRPAAAVPAAQDAGPAAVAGRRPRRPRPARRRALRRDGPAHRERRRARVPDHRVRSRPAGSAARPAASSRPTRSTRSTRYVGGENPDAAPAGRLGLGEDQGPAPARRSREIAAELIRLYSARMATPRATRSARTPPWQRELEDAFPYAETPDQLAAIDEVKADMEKPLPMDRIICGDVGYGKTEVAVRAAFKAVQDGKQVAVLVPTTLLAQQHLATFTERMSQFPL